MKSKNHVVNVGVSVIDLTSYNAMNVTNRHTWYVHRYLKKSLTSLVVVQNPSFAVKNVK